MHTLIFVIILALYYGNLILGNLPEYEIEEQELYTTNTIVYIRHYKWSERTNLMVQIKLLAIQHYI